MHGLGWIGIVSATDRLRFMVVLAVLGMSVMISPLAAQTAECDRLGASPLDPSRPPGVPGVAVDRMDAPAAISACTQALAENPGNPRIKYQLARAMFKANTALERAITLYRESANGGSLVAINNLAAMYNAGQGVSPDNAEATRLFRKAAEAGLPVAMDNLAVNLASGTGVEKNEQEAFVWVQKAAATGDASSIETLALTYTFGRLGVKRDHEKAAFLQQKAAAAGSSAGQKFMASFRVLQAAPKKDIAALQRQLIDSKCFDGEMDGNPSMRLQVAFDACPDQRPQLRIETGMHVASISKINVDSKCRLAATASDDKTVRLWSFPDGRLLRVLRAPIGPGPSGELDRVAVSPDGRFVAAAGHDAEYSAMQTSALTIYDFGTGDILKRVGPFDTVRITGVVFSSDGRWLAVTLGNAKGVRMIDTADWRVVASDKSYSENSADAAFGPDDRLYTAGLDGVIRRYGPGPEFTKEAEVRTPEGERAAGIAVDPQGQRLAVSSDNTVELYDPLSLKHLRRAKAEKQDREGLYSIAWRRDGAVLLAGGASYRRSVAFDRDGHLLSRSSILASSTIMSIKPCGDGFVFAAADPVFGLLDSLGNKISARQSVSIDSRPDFELSGDARRVRFNTGFEFGTGGFNQVLFDLTAASLTDAPTTSPDLRGSDRDLKSVMGDRVIYLHGETLDSVAVRPDRSGFAIGTSSSLRAFDAVTNQLWRQPSPAETWRVNLSADGRIVVARYGDGTIRWHRWSDGQELLALFVNKDTKAWVAWTPSGYYSASPGGEDMIGWHVNRGWDQAADFFPASKFRDTYARPDIVEKILDTLDEGEAIKQANAERGGKIRPAVSVTESLPPVVSILSPEDGANVEDEAHLDYLVRSPSGLPVDAVEALIDGRPASNGRGLGRLPDTDALKQCLAETHGAGRSDGALQGCRGSLTVSLPPGTSEVGIIARAGDRTSVVTKIRLTRGTAPSATEILKPKLYALVVGISAYQNHDLVLAYAAKDARDFAAALQNQKGGLYGDVEVRSIENGQATAKAIREGLDWLTKQVTSRDVGLVYLAGHGALDTHEHFYFLAADSDSQELRATAIPHEDIQDALRSLSGKALLFLDACHSGAVMGSSGRRGTIDINTIVNDLAQTDNGVTVYAASTGRQVSQENEAWNNGAFTKAVVEGLGLPGLKGKADFAGTGAITTSELDVYVTQRVKALTGGEQSPVMIRPPTVPDFPLAVAR